MVKKVLICLYGNDVAPRFDLATEVMIASMDENGQLQEEKIVVLPHASAEKMCHLVLTEDVKTVICGGIEEEYHQYLTWKRVEVIDSVMGSSDLVLERFSRGELQVGDILFSKAQRQSDGG